MDFPLLGVPLQTDRFPLTCFTREGQVANSTVHTHNIGQLVYPEKGTAILETPNVLVRLETDRAAWIPARLPHSVIMNRAFRYHSLYIDPIFYSNGLFGVIAVTALLRELILDASTWSNNRLDFRRRYPKAMIIVDELRNSKPSASGVGIPADKRIAAICRKLEQEPATNKSIEEWAREAGASTKTIQRSFVASTGRTFQQWRHHVRMTRALEYHARGMRLLDIALAVGYETEGAYAQAFKKFYGHAPSALKARKF